MEGEGTDLSGALDMLKNMLSGEEGQQQIQNILGMFQGVTPQTDCPGESTGGIDPDGLEMMLKLQQAMTAMKGKQQSEEAGLLLALRPFLKPKRQEKVDHAMKLLKFSGLIKMMREVQEG